MTIHEEALRYRSIVADLDRLIYTESREFSRWGVPPTPRRVSVEVKIFQKWLQAYLVDLPGER